MNNFATVVQVKIAVGVAVLGLGVALGACSSSSSTSNGTDAGSATDAAKGDSGGSGGDAGGGCVPVGTPGDSTTGAGKYCTIESDCVGNKQATICATIEGDPTEDFCTFVCTPVDGGTDPCGEGSSCACDPSNPSQCGCTPLSCQ